MQFLEMYGTRLDSELGSADRTQLFTTAKRKQAINDAMHNFERETSCTPKTGLIPISDGVAEYDVYDNFSDYISLDDRREPAVKRFDSNGNVSWIQGEAFPRRTPGWLDRETPGWQADPKGVPSSWQVVDHDGRTFFVLDPAPNPNTGNETWQLYVPYLAKSADMTNDQDRPFTVSGQQSFRLEPYHQGLIHYAAALLEPLRKGYSAAQRQMGLYAGYIAQYETKKRKDGPNQITFRRNYYRDAVRTSRPVDPHRFP